MISPHMHREEKFQSFNNQGMFATTADGTRFYFKTISGDTRMRIGGMLFKSPDQRVERIKITPRDLYNMAQTGNWSIEYPEHSIPEKRHDLTINTIVLIVAVLGLITWFLL